MTCCIDFGSGMAMPPCSCLPNPGEQRDPFRQMTFSCCTLCMSMVPNIRTHVDTSQMDSLHHNCECMCLLHRPILHRMLTRMLSCRQPSPRSCTPCVRKVQNSSAELCKLYRIAKTILLGKYRRSCVRQLMHMATVRRSDCSMHTCLARTCCSHPLEKRTSPHIAMERCTHHSQSLSKDLGKSAGSLGCSLPGKGSLRCKRLQMPVSARCSFRVNLALQRKGLHRRHLRCIMLLLSSSRWDISKNLEGMQTARWLVCFGQVVQSWMAM